VLECVVNVSEGRRAGVLDTLRLAAAAGLLDVHVDPHHNRSVFTLAGPDVIDVVCALAREVVVRIDITEHEGVHPRIGALDVVPFVPLDGSTLADARAARDTFAAWAGAELALPCFIYGPERTLPEVRRGAFASFAPDTGPRDPHPTAGGCAVGARAPLVAYNVWLADDDVAMAREVAAAVRRPEVRALGLRVGTRVQVSMNLLAPDDVDPAMAYDTVAAHAAVAGAELVGLVPASVLERVPAGRWAELDLSPTKTIEARLREAGLDGGRFGGG
jgi:glutamate formiminotransferase / 5-formyltetrahydrofolate cyclo-ligase